MFVQFLCLAGVILLVCSVTAVVTTDALPLFIGAGVVYFTFKVAQGLSGGV